MDVKANQSDIKTIHHENNDIILASTQAVAPTDLPRRIQVIGAGFSRTATVSFTLALQKLLNGPVCHGGAATLMREEAFIRKLIVALNPSNRPSVTKSHLTDLLAGYVAVTDWAGYMFVQELVELYPEAMVIVTTRDPERWWESYKDLKKIAPWWLGYVLAIMPKLRLFNAWGAAMRKKGDAILPPGTKIEGPEFLDTYHDHLRRIVPRDRLVFFDVKQGWGPLCKVLQVETPDEPFPHANDRSALQAVFKELIGEALRRWVLYGVLFGSAVAWAWILNAG